LRLHWLLCVVVALLCITACRPNLLEKALRGELPPEEGNLIIFGYCQTCHIHRTLDPSEHLARIRPLYDRVPYTATTQCRACHLVSENTWGIRHRKTIFPADVAQNRYTSHERRFLKEQPELTKGQN
jgi:hypothetical protein